MRRIEARRLRRDARVLDRNGVRFEHPPSGLDGTAQAIEDVAASVLAEKDFIAWVRARTVS